MWTYIIALLVFISTYIYIKFKRSYNYWKNLNVPYVPGEFPVGSAGILQNNVNFGEVMKQFYDKLTNNGNDAIDYYGLYLLKHPVLFVLSPEFAKTVLVKDFEYFQDRGGYFNERDDPLSAHMFVIRGEKWRKIRQKVTPTFTSGKMKMMFRAVIEVADQLNDTLGQHLIKDDVVDIKEIISCFTTDVIGTCAFGIECNSLKSPDSEFRKYGKKMFQFSNFGRFKLLFTTVFMKESNALGLMFNHQDVADFFLKAVRDTIDQREKHNIKRDDFMQLLINLKNKGMVDITDDQADGNLENRLTFEEVAAQAYLFFVAGFETSSSTITCALHQLAVYKDIQERARENVRVVLKKYNNQITYESLSEMKYLENVINETLRLFPTLPTTFRMCTKAYQLPNKSVINPGTMVLIPIYGFQMCDKYFPNPTVFNPNRFDDEVKSERHPFAYLPFGEGPRNCIGQRFGLMQTKIGLATMLNNYEFDVCEKTEVPIVMNPNTPSFGPRGAVNLRVRKV